MPSYARDGVVEVAFASQKRYLSLYVMRQAALQAHSDRLAGLSVGKGCVRFGRGDAIDPDLVRALLQATVADTGEMCSRSPGERRDAPTCTVGRLAGYR